MVQGAEVKSHGITSCTLAVMQMDPSALRSEEPVSAHHLGDQYSVAYRATGAPPVALIAPAVSTAAAVQCHLLQLSCKWHWTCLSALLVPSWTQYL